MSLSNSAIGLLCIAALLGVARATPLGASLPSNPAGAAEPTGLQCEYRVNPLGVDSVHPRLEWVLTPPDPAARGITQHAYQIIVASSAQAVMAGLGDLWDSGKVGSDRTNQIAYAGASLGSNQAVWWSVRTWDQADRPSAWAAPAHWTMGIVDKVGWRGAAWIAAPDAKQPPPKKGPKLKYETVLFRRAFTVKPGLMSATVNLCGLGQYELTLNGARVGDALLAPGWTDYKKTCLYDSYDITSSLKPGPNVAGLFLGNGFYNVHEGRYTKVRGSFGPLQAIAVILLKYRDGTVETIVTDANWRSASGPITFSSIYGGEDYDARLVQEGWDRSGFDDSAWEAPTLMQGPGGELKGLSCAAPAIRSMLVLTPPAPRQLNPNVAIYDLGQNASLMLSIKVKGPAGSTVKISPSEILGKNGDIEDRMTGGQSFWTYTLRGEGDEDYSSKFYYRGARYLRVEVKPPAGGNALPEVTAIEGHVIRADCPSVGQFFASNDLFNKIDSLVRWAQMNNMMSIMTDCPTREKLGWLEEDHLNGPALRYNFDMGILFTKMTNDMFDGQRANGLVPSLVPNYYQWDESKFTTPIEWGSACIIVPWQQYQFEGDIELLNPRYEGMKRYLEYVKKRAKNNIVSFGLGDWYDNHSEGAPTLTPVELTDTAFYYQDLRIVAQIAVVLGKADEAASFEQNAEQVRIAFNQKFFNPSANSYASGAQGSNCLPLAMNLVDPGNRQAVFDNLIKDYQNKGTTTGEVSYEYLLRALADGGRSDLIYSSCIDDTQGYALQVKLGKTSLTEAWNGGSSSQDHFMFGQINEWFYHDLAGIQPDPAGPGFKKIIIRPAVVSDLTSVKATYRSICGDIVSNWSNGPAGLIMTMTIPAGSTATVYVPSANPDAVKEGKVPASSAPGVQLLRAEKGLAVFTIGSGTYSFSSAPVPAFPAMPSAAESEHATH